ncbi:MAG: hypothetical protein C0504_08410 [Candidatus Solibacter sp.]|nr:hypothetical protein [Candidatus Solibacter sp.]
MVRSIVRLLLPLLCALALQAHDLSLQIELSPPVVLVHAVYGGGQPVANSRVYVGSPVEPDKLHQTGLTDSLGYFAFRPSSPGDWLIAVDDEMGHRQEMTIQVPDPFAAASSAPAPAGPSRFDRALLGIALIIGISGLWYGLRTRRA